jgi:hypothetical protein
VRSRLSFTSFLLLPFLYINSKCDFWMIGVLPRVPQSFIDQSGTEHLPHARFWQNCRLGVQRTLLRLPRASAAELIMEDYQEPIGDRHRRSQHRRAGAGGDGVGGVDEGGEWCHPYVGRAHLGGDGRHRCTARQQQCPCGSGRGSVGSCTWR